MCVNKRKKINVECKLKKCYNRELKILWKEIKKFNLSQPVNLPVYIKKMTLNSLCSRSSYPEKFNLVWFRWNIL